MEDAGEPIALEHSIHESLHGKRAQGCLLRRLPNADVAADRSQERIPRPDRNWEVERTDDSDDAEWMPLLVHPMLRPFGMHGEAVQHARLAHREVRDVDHLLHFA